MFLCLKAFILPIAKLTLVLEYRCVINVFQFVIFPFHFLGFITTSSPFYMIYKTCWNNIPEDLFQKRGLQWYLSRVEVAAKFDNYFTDLQLSYLNIITWYWCCNLLNGFISIVDNYPLQVYQWWLFLKYSSWWRTCVASWPPMGGTAGPGTRGDRTGSQTETGTSKWTTR